MPLFDLLFIGLSIVWVLEFIFFKSRKGKNEQEEAASFPWIMLSVVFVIVISLVSRETGLLLLPFTWLPFAGSAVYALGIFLRYSGIIALGRQFTRDVQIRSSDRIVSGGPFRLLRHPLYTGLFCIVTGFALFTASLAGLLLVLFLFLPFLLQRIRIEERMLKEAFGPEYEKWLEPRYRLIPFLY
ncbi:methyltransferase family protein [Alkalicoccus halolimnae]|uniref:Isoprenylcysteine carboxylmethyltransferase family protein n=1 Tax=Alkalicoccus halolimnae TaxID=1667239 RepID=A0AAJ8N059_9BACI|nr:isoprenylcysteine carboxylmethyltransferase family protein [Alkalicoccus halolimnae]